MQLEWINDRWHLDGRPIHAGCGIEVRWPDGTWQPVRVESQDSGRRIYAHFDYHGFEMAVRLDGYNDGVLKLRWPQ